MKGGGGEGRGGGELDKGIFIYQNKQYQSDRPGGIAELARIIANVGVSIKDIVHERAWVRQNTFSVEVANYFQPAIKIIKKYIYMISLCCR